MIKVFVYGTLMKGNTNHETYLKNQEYLGKAVLKDFAIYNLGWYPGIIPEEGQKTKGEIYNVDHQTLSLLDRLEGEGSLYLRKKVKVIIEDKSEAETFVYVWNSNVDEKSKIAFQNQPWRRN